MNIEENKSVITKKELMSAFWRSLLCKLHGTMKK